MENNQIIIEAVDLFIKNKNIFIGYPNEEMKAIGKNKRIYIDNVEVKSKYIGNEIFVFVDTISPFKDKFASMTTCLKKQFLSLY